MEPEKAPSRPPKVVPIRNVQVHPEPQAASPLTDLFEPVDLLTQMRNRALFLDMKIAECAGFAAERKMLARMLAAAEKKAK